MSTYLVDFENMRCEGLMGIDELTNADQVTIFYSNSADTLSFEMHQKILASKAHIEYFKLNKGGKNALDFQLTSYLGYLIGKQNDETYYIISKDTGFDSAVSFCREQLSENTFKVGRLTRIKDALTQNTVVKAAQPSTSAAKGSIDLQFARLLKNLCDTKDLEKIINLFNLSLKETHAKQAFHIALVKIFGQPKGSSIYNAIKPHYQSLVS